jgi:protein-glutamine gamma-glutamyltransferase
MARSIARVVLKPWRCTVLIDMARAKKIPPTFAPLPRTDVLWLAAGLLLAAIPHVLLIAPWVSAFFFFTLAWRAYISWRGRAMPPRWQILALAAIAMAGIYLGYRTLVGRDAGVALLLIMSSLKLLEMRNRRDAMLTAFLGYFMVLTEFLYSQSMTLGAYALMVAWLITAAVVGIHRTDNAAGFRERLMPAARLLLQAVPMMLILFILFPRVGGPLWSMPQNKHVSKSGLSEKLEIGNVNELALSSEVAFRAEFDAAMPSPASLYWRGPVMWDVENNIWRVRKAYPKDSAAFTPIGETISYNITMEASEKLWAFALDLPAQTPSGLRATADYQLISPAPINTRLRYRASSHLKYSLGENEAKEELQRALMLPQAGAEKTRALANKWRDENSNGQTIVKKALIYFRENPFSYTLSPSLLGDNPIDEFMFRTRSGFCEHYASSFVYLMRAAGVPARIVTGYQGGEINPVGNYLIVRQSDAHAWAEVWLPKRGWVRVDPTAAVSPDRIEVGMEAALPSSAANFAGIPFPKQITWLNSLRLNWDALNNRYNVWVLGYNMERQQKFLSSLGLGEVDWRNMAMWMALLASAAGAILAAFLLAPKQRAKQDAAQKHYEKFCAQLARRGLARAAHEGPLDFLKRIEHDNPELAEQARAITALYVGLRYGNDQAENINQLAQRVRTVKFS